VGQSISRPSISLWHPRSLRISFFSYSIWSITHANGPFLYPCSQEKTMLWQTK
jgi:hypothetical protein